MDRTKLFLIIAIILSVILIVTFSVLLMFSPSGEKEAAVRLPESRAAAERSAEDKDMMRRAPSSPSPGQKDVEAEPEAFAESFEGRYGLVNIVQYILYAGSLASAIWIMIIAFKNDGAMQGILCLCCCPYTLYYGISRFQLVKKPFIILIVSLLFGILLGVFVIGDAALMVNQIMQMQGN